MIQIFKNLTYFSILFFIVLGLDIYVKLELTSFPYRYLSKPLVMVLLLCFYWINQNETEIKKRNYTLLGICSFLIGDIFLITHLDTLLLISGMTLFMAGKVFYSLRFSHTSDFNLKRLVPFLLVIFAFMAVLFSFIYDNLNDLFIPVLFYFFVSLLTLQIAYLRRDTVNFRSYMLVLISIEVFVVGESIMALKMFYQDIPFQDIIIMFAYGVSQYFIIIGLLNEAQNKIKLTND